ncbi:hydantoinase B/oxoprolinase family protein [Shewanella sp. D64]|uniref:hydantoinase B/oxoprolinase family protein n=1 Tax=unclassified Shewanella TaxID=196818 RepID=UPI0022BA4506|nr:MULTISPECIES: hydantoinase B/oxoprolinase family protein [unclassified Shewanella]MEC4724987.1 hydantoinase B/oxoprolinase family protein [Shewanella sp. D64]MEC4736888.1 hydantoinase B/oxoprolinase family protein [Shewanella sp. E94]WBJ96485.1 hydantoinase B/oxoprolinase family protein [Shewanella sp. MTB7]
MHNNDPITLEIIQNSLRSISDEMFYTIAKTAMSPIIYEVLDMATAITDPKGELASAGAGIPAFVGALDKSVKAIIAKFELEQINDGDIFITNDPYYGGVTHLNDVVLIKPVFMAQEIIAWAVNIAHWNDVSGKSPGSMSVDATEIYQEGIRIPAVKLFVNDEPIQSVIDMLTVNSRMPDFLKGDLWAQISALRLGSKRIISLINKYGKSTYIQAVDSYLELGQAMAEKAIKALPDGKYEINEAQDDGSHLFVSIEVADTSLIIDLTQAPEQSALPINLSKDGTMLACQMALMGLIGDRQLANGGCFRVLDVKTRVGSIYDVSEPGPCGIYFETMIRLNDLIWRCLAEKITDSLPSGNFSSICATIMGGKHPDTGKHYSIIEPEIGGWGAGDGFDGANAMFCAMHGDTFNCPAEIAETRYGVTVGQVALNDEDAGAGEYRGGKGVVIDYVIRSDNSFLTCAYTRNKIAPWGLNKGQDGSVNRVEVIRTNGTVEEYAMASEVTLDSDDIVRIITANGAGFGDPKQRKTAALMDDIRNGYVSLEYAKEHYGFSASRGGSHE